MPRLLHLDSKAAVSPHAGVHSRPQAEASKLGIV
jgi:hypothetical protein